MKIGDVTMQTSTSLTYLFTNQKRCHSASFRYISSTSSRHITNAPTSPAWSQPPFLGSVGAVTVTATIRVSTRHFLDILSCSFFSACSIAFLCACAFASSSTSPLILLTCVCNLLCRASIFWACSEGIAYMSNSEGIVYKWEYDVN